MSAAVDLFCLSYGLTVLKEIIKRDVLLCLKLENRDANGRHSFSSSESGPMSGVSSVGGVGTSILKGVGILLRFCEYFLWKDLDVRCVKLIVLWLDTSGYDFLK
jgi:hypothetical protein